MASLLDVLHRVEDRCHTPPQFLSSFRHPQVTLNKQSRSPGQSYLGRPGPPEPWQRPSPALPLLLPHPYTPLQETEDPKALVPRGVATPEAEGGPVFGDRGRGDHAGHHASEPQRCQGIRTAGLPWARPLAGGCRVCPRGAISGVLGMRAATKELPLHPDSCQMAASLKTAPSQQEWHSWALVSWFSTLMTH